MRSLLIIEVEHGETTDDLQSFAECVARYAPADSENMLIVRDYAVAVDQPEHITANAVSGILS